MITIPLYHIHSKNIVHKDLNPDNILQNFIGDKEIYLISDFGSSLQPNTECLTSVKNIMTAFYASIDQSNLDKAHPSYDIWSIGIMLYFLMAKKVSFPQIGIIEIVDAILNN